MEICNISWTFTVKPDGQVEPKPKVDPGVLFFSDIDDTFVPWVQYNQQAETDKIERTQATLQALKGETVNALCSARGLSSIQALMPYLEGMPLQVLGVNGGQQVFVNYDNLPADQWLPSLTPQDADAGWQAVVSERSGGFSTPAVLKDLKDTLQDLGFHRSHKPLPKPLEKREVYLASLTGKGDEVAVVALSPDQSSFMVRANPTDLSAPLKHNHRQLARRIAHELETKMQQKGVQMEAKRFIDDGEHIIYLLQPKNIDKQSLLEHLIGRYPSVQAVITAGDHINDTMLTPSSYGEVPNYRIVSGERPEVATPLLTEPNVAQVPKGELSLGLVSHMIRLKAEAESEP